MKRTIDIVISAAAIAAISPLMILIAVWVKLDSRGPILFKQKRVGLNQKVFRIYKFRTMIDRDPDSIDQMAEQVIATGRDSRITPSGKILRGASLDELPQLFNVLRGEMSLVGPRPVLEAQLEAIPSKNLDRFEVLPGITGLAQVRGRRGLGWLSQLEYDSEYVHTKSTARDFIILIRTVSLVFGQEGVYADETKNWRAYLPQNESKNEIYRQVDPQ